MYSRMSRYGYLPGTGDKICRIFVENRQVGNFILLLMGTQFLVVWRFGRLPIASIPRETLNPGPIREISCLYC